MNVWGDPTHHAKHSLISSHTSAQQRKKGPTGYSGMPQIHPKNCPFPFDDNHPHLIHHPLTNPTHYPNGIWIQSAVLPQYTLQTDREMDQANVPWHEHSTRYADTEWRTKKVGRHCMPTLPIFTLCWYIAHICLLYDFIINEWMNEWYPWNFFYFAASDLLFPVHVRFFSMLLKLVVPSYSSFTFSRKGNTGIFLICLWPMTLIYKHDLDRVKTDHNAKYLEATVVAYCIFMSCCCFYILFQGRVLTTL